MYGVPLRFDNMSFTQININGMETLVGWRDWTKKGHCNLICIK